jgi:hypothetical protein
LRGGKTFILILILCVSFAVTGIGVKNLFAEWMECDDFDLPPRCSWNVGCSGQEPDPMGCLVFGCYGSPGYLDCFNPW